MQFSVRDIAQELPRKASKIFCPKAIEPTDLHRRNVTELSPAPCVYAFFGFKPATSRPTNGQKLRRLMPQTENFDRRFESTSDARCNLLPATRDYRFFHRNGMGRGGAVGRDLGVGIGLGVAVGVALGVRVAVGVTVGVGVGVGDD